MTHLPFRSWCRHCITGSGREEDCRKASEEERQVPEIHLGKHWHLSGTRTSNESSAQHRGPDEVDGIMDMSKALGVAAIGLEFVDIIVRSDNEPALTSLRPLRTMRAMKVDQE